MTADAAAARWGIQQRYTDTSGAERVAPDHVVEQVIGQLRRGEEAEGPTTGDEIAFLPHGRTDLPAHLLGRRLVTEDGADLGAVAELPPDLPLGYHRLVDDRDGHHTELVLHPDGCHRPDDLRAWGWALQLHSDRSTASWGIGDLADARAIGAWSRAQGGRPMLLLNPLHAPNLGDDPQPSPYFASSRCFLNPLSLRIEEVEGAEAMGEALADLAAAGRALNAERLIDRRTVWAVKREALERIWAGPGHQARRAEAARRPADPCADAFARFTVAIEQHGEPWWEWPTGLRTPDGHGWPELVARHADRVAFHTWVQQEVAGQLHGVEAVVPVLHDLAIGSDRAGFDAWYWSHVFVLDGTRIGAPADQFNTLGQDWGLPPMDPWRLRAARYEPFVRMLRCALSAGSGLRIDHVMGMFRLFWIPPGATPADGVYVRQPAEELLALIALESTRAEGIVVGEDLGTVEPGVREALAARRFLSYRVMALDDVPVEDYPRSSLASISTHDLPTTVGFWTGRDLADQQRLDLHPPAQEFWDARDAFGHRIGVPLDAPVNDVVIAAHRHLTRAGSCITLAQLEDAALVAERPNMPGTTDAWPNWSLALPEPIETVLASPLAVEVAQATRGPLGPSER